MSRRRFSPVRGRRGRVRRDAGLAAVTPLPTAAQRRRVALALMHIDKLIMQKGLESDQYRLLGALAEALTYLGGDKA